MNENLYSIPIEQSILSTLMTQIGGIDDSIGAISPEHFYAGQHNIIFKHIKKLYSGGELHDVVMVWDSIKLDANDSKIVNEKFLIDLMNDSPSTALLLDQHTRKLIEHARRRSLFNAGERIKAISLDTTQYDVDTAIAQSEGVVASVDKGGSSEKLKGAFELSVDLYEKMVVCEQNRLAGIEEVEGISSGFQSLDNQVGTFKNGDLIYIGARPSMGKTAFSQDIILSVGFYQQLPVLFHSVEMKSEKIMKRFIASMASINLKDLGRNYVPSEKWGDFNKASLKLQKSKIFIDDRSEITLSDIRKRCREIKREHGVVGLVVVDYLTLIKPQMQSDRNDLMIGSVSKGLKKIAKEFDCPVVCLAQLNRSVEKRADKRPMLSDLRESGSMEEDGDVILFLYRDDYYEKNSKDAGTVEVIAAKVRDGEVGTVRLATEFQYSRFCELDMNYHHSQNNF